VKRFPPPHVRQLAAVVSMGLLVPPNILPAPPGPPDAKAHERAPYASAPLRDDARILHALNRFTFGPRPGDLETVRAMGLDRWFDEQLHPANIPNADLDARLAAFPAMQWSTEDLLRRLPSNAIIRQALDDKIDLPDYGILHAVYKDAMYRVAKKKQEKQNKPQPQPPEMNAGAARANDARPKPMDSLDGDAAESPSPTAPDSESITRLLALTPEQRIQRLTAMPPAETSAFFTSLRGPQRAALVEGMPPELKETVGALEGPERIVIEELVAQRLTRDIYSSAQLQQVMTDFWFNHFNVFLRKNEATPYYLVSYERDVIRPHSLGKFEDLLEGVAHSPAMLIYLDNANSTGPDSLAAQRAKLNPARNPNAKKNRQGLNENYARELMELHTLGVNGGYTQADVIQVARILTGWTVDRPQRGGDFRFDPNRHEPGAKKVMGHKFKENGEREGRDLLHFLATRPATARFLSRKLAVRFVSDDPPATLINRMAATYMSSSGDISAVLTTLFHSPEFWTTNTYHAKVKTPLEYVASAVRAGNADIANLRPLANALREMGMPLYGAVPPTGYKWDAADWVSTGALVNRMNFALALAANRLPGITTDWSQVKMGETWDASPHSEESRIEAKLIPGGLSATTRAAVLQQFETQSASSDQVQTMPISSIGRPQNQKKQDQLLAGLLLGSPEFQRR
jgi:uncharacterized protein (DUF1800 family)